TREDACDLALRLSRHGLVKDPAFFRMTGQVRPGTAWRDFVCCRSARSDGMLQDLEGLPEDRHTDHAHVGSHGLWVIRAQQSRSRRMNVSTFFGFKDSIRGNQP